jgi:hypothetical protein
MVEWNALERRVWASVWASNQNISGLKKAHKSTRLVFQKSSEIERNNQENQIAKTNNLLKKSIKLENFLILYFQEYKLVQFFFDEKFEK